MSINECEIMNLFWSVKEPLSKSDVVALSPKRRWKEKSIHILLNSLLAKGMIEVSGFVSTRTNIGRTFSPCCTQEEYISFLVQTGGHPAKINAARLFSALHEKGEIDEDTIAELENIIQTLRKKKE